MNDDKGRATGPQGMKSRTASDGAGARAGNRSGPSRIPKNGDRPGHPSFGGELMADILEPHASLRYIARLFKALAVLLLILLIAELVLGLIQQGQEAVPTLMVEATRLVVFAGVLWGLGDIALMLIESNHDLRATRLMVWQLNALMKMRMEREGIPVEPVQPPMERGADAGIRED